MEDYLKKCYECRKELDQNDIERSEVFCCGGKKVRICESCKDSIVEGYLNRSEK